MTSISHSSLLNSLISNWGRLRGVCTPTAANWLSVLTDAAALMELHLLRVLYIIVGCFPTTLQPFGGVWFMF